MREVFTVQPGSPPPAPEREYQCLGQWTEDGRIYALTYRRDIRTYECFVGVIKSDGTVFIKEAESEAGCSRNVQPEVFGMKLQRKGESPFARLLSNTEVRTSEGVGFTHLHHREYSGCENDEKERLRERMWVG